MEKIRKMIKTWFKSAEIDGSNAEIKKRNFWRWDTDMSRLFIVFLFGVFLLLLSFPSKKHDTNRVKTKSLLQGEEDEELIQTESTEDTAWTAMNRYAAKQEEELERVLASVSGVGKVEVMLTLASSEEKKTLLQENTKQESTKESDSRGGERNQNVSSLETEPILIKEGDEQIPYIVRIESPQVEGVVVVAQGAGSGSVDTEIIAAVEALFPIEVHKIKVMKMKGDQ